MDTANKTKMYTVIKNYCNNGNNNGLFLLDMPTGYGKTYSVLQYIYDASLDKSNSKKRFFFITTLKKNLPIEELKTWFKDNEKIKEFEEKFLFIDANADCVIDGLTSNIIKEMPDEIKKTDEYKSLLNDVKFLQNGANKAELREFIGNVKDNLRSKSEPNFRRLLQTMLAKEFSTVDKRICEIKTNKRWQWLGKLYPAVFTRDKQIIFMSMDKFLVKNTTIVEPSYMFYNSDIIDNATIFIDEFDATKETILKNIIQNGLRDKIDYIELFKDIYSALHTNEFPAILTTPSNERQKSEYKNKTLQSIIEGIKNKADAIYNDYNLQFSHRTEEGIADNTKNFLFQDYKFHSILDGKNSYITIASDAKMRVNKICFSCDKPEVEKNNIQVMLGKLRGFIKYFQNGINILAINYMQCKAEHKKDGDDEFTMESAIRSVLEVFRLNSTYIDYITSQILNEPHKVKGNIENSDFDLSFYEKGFRFYSFEDAAVHDMQSKIMMCSFQTTPEKILLRFCEKAKVIGISATATVPTVIGNYDLDYLRLKMQTAFSLPSEDDKKSLGSDFSESFCNYKNKGVSITAELLGKKAQDNYSVDAWKEVFKTDEISKKIFDRIEQELPNSEDNYHKKRYIRIALAYKRFIMHNDIQSFLCVLTKHPRKGDKYLNKDVLNEIFKYIVKENQSSINTETYFYQLDGDEYDIKKDEITSKLSKGQKLFIISVYQTIGAGQNLQYTIPIKLEKELIKINDRSLCKEKDFDAIYLDKPTNLLVNLGNNLSEEEFVKYLYHIEFLQETSELSMCDAFKYIKRAFCCYIDGNTDQLPHAPSPYNTKSVVFLSTRTIIQAIGRICRTNQKRKNIYVFADNRIAENIDLSILNDRLLNEEFVALLNEIGEQSNAQIGEASLENKAAYLSVRVNKKINNMLREDWTDARIEEWQKLRELVLTSPTMSEAEVSKNFVAKNSYVKLPAKNDHLFYKHEDDYSKIEIGFTKNGSSNLEVSDVAAKLNILMSIPELKDFFVKKGWATHFEKNDYIMSPPLFNNIYKGALGEVVGRYLFWQVLKLEMEEISDPELFELFDYKVKNRPIYVDFKNWHETTIFYDDEMLNKINNKAIKCGCKYVIIANIVSKKEWETHRKELNGLTIVEIPSLLVGTDSLKYDDKAWKEIRRCINEFSD